MKTDTTDKTYWVLERADSLSPLYWTGQGIGNNLKWWSPKISEAIRMHDWSSATTAAHNLMGRGVERLFVHVREHMDVTTKVEARQFLVDLGTHNSDGSITSEYGGDS